MNHSAFHLKNENPTTDKIIIIVAAIPRPHKTASIVFLKLILSMDAASVPVHAPVPGTGIPTKSITAIKRPAPFRPSLSPAFSPFYNIHAQGFPILFLSLPHSRNLLAKKYIKGTGIRFPAIHTAIAAAIGTGGLNAWDTIIDPLSSHTGSIDIKNIFIRFTGNICVLSNIEPLNIYSGNIKHQRS